MVVWHKIRRRVNFVYKAIVILFNSNWLTFSGCLPFNVVNFFNVVTLLTFFDQCPFSKICISRGITIALITTNVCSVIPRLHNNNVVSQIKMFFIIHSCLEGRLLVIALIPSLNPCTISLDSWVIVSPCIVHNRILFSGNGMSNYQVRSNSVWSLGATQFRLHALKYHWLDIFTVCGETDSISKIEVQKEETFRLLINVVRTSP